MFSVPASSNFGDGEALHVQSRYCSFFPAFSRAARGDRRGFEGRGERRTGRAARAARSVHLAYEGRDEVAFYNEMRVEKSTPGSYFMAAGFQHGYFGIQEQNQGRKVVIFSVWDPTKGDDAAAVPLEQRVEILHQGEGVEVKRFGGEGTGGQSFFPYDWKLGDTYRFLVKVAVDGEKTAYSGYFYLPESKSWKHLVTFRTRTGGEHLQGLYSFVEDFRRDGKSPNEARRASFGNGWTQNASGRWKQLTRTRFTASGAVVGSERYDRRRASSKTRFYSANRRRHENEHAAQLVSGTQAGRIEAAANSVVGWVERSEAHAVL